MGSGAPQSFCERMLSCANNVIGTNITLLSDELIEILAVLRMNRDFMEFMRLHYKDAARQHFGMTIVDED